MRSPQDIYISYVARYPKTAPIHAAIAAMEPGDPLPLRRNSRGWFTYNAHDRGIGKLAKGFVPSNTEASTIAGMVHAISTVRHKDQDPEYAIQCVCEQWELIVPELVYRARR